MQNPEVIRRRWLGFGECRITVAPCKAAEPASLPEKIFTGAARRLSRSGLGSLSFKVDPAWILRESETQLRPIVSQFLRVHRQALAEEWKARQIAISIPAPAKASVAIPVRQEAKPNPTPAPRPQRDKGLPSWFEAYCGPTRIRN